MTLQDLLALNGGGSYGASMPFPGTNNPADRGGQSAAQSVLNGGASAIRMLLPALFAGSGASTAAPTSTAGVAPSAPPPGSFAAPSPVPMPMADPRASAIAGPVPMPQPAPGQSPGAPMNLAPTNPGPSPGVGANPFYSGPGAPSPALANYVNALRGAQLPQQQDQSGQGSGPGPQGSPFGQGQGGPGQSQGLFPKLMNDANMIKGLFGGSAAGSASASPLILGSLF